MGATVVARDVGAGFSTRFSKLPTQKAYSLFSGKISLLEILPNFVPVGQAVKLKYEPKASNSKKSQELWLFRRYPQFDFQNSIALNLKDTSKPAVGKFGSAYHFELEAVEPIYETNLLMTNGKGGGLAFGGAILILMGLLFIALSFGQDGTRYWSFWDERFIAIVAKPSLSALATFRSEFISKVKKMRKGFVLIDPDIDEQPLEVKQGGI